jgi:predicted phage tail protein
MKRDVILHGHLKEKFGDKFSLDVATAGEAIRALNVNFQTFIEELKEGSYYIICGDQEQGLSLDLEDVNEFKLGSKELHIMPVIEGSSSEGKGGGILKAILGVALIGAAIFFSGGALAAPIANGAMMGMTYGNLAMMGLALTLAGVSQLLSPQEKKDEDKKDESFIFSGPGNSYEQGSAVPVIYGEVITGGVMISGGVDIENIGVAV